MRFLGLQGLLLAGAAACSVPGLEVGVIAGTGGAVVTTDTDTATTAGDGGAGGEAAVQAGLAAECQTDADCSAGLRCLRDVDDDPIFGGGPPGGFCTCACASDVDCLQPDGVCLRADSEQPGLCTLGCVAGPEVAGTSGLLDALDGSKCRGREDLRCGEITNGAGVCLPTCGDDVQCGERVCDARLAVCVASAHTGASTGAACEPLDQPSACAGLCVGFDSGDGICSSPCVLGGEVMHTLDCGGPALGLCAFHAKGHGPGDTGFCTPACSKQSECTAAAFFCFSVPGVSEHSGKGYCFAATACPGGEVECATSLVCTTTSSGPYCLDPAYPLGP